MIKMCPPLESVVVEKCPEGFPHSFNHTEPSGKRHKERITLFSTK
jgi:hypothetical protein